MIINRKNILNSCVILSLGLLICSSLSTVVSATSLDACIYEDREYSVCQTTGDKTRFSYVCRNTFKDADGITHVKATNGQSVTGMMFSPSRGSVLFVRNAIECLNSGTIMMDIYYDYNGDGKNTDDELFKTENITFSQAKNMQRYIKVGEAATKKYGTSSRFADLFAVEAYIYCNYPYGQTLGGSIEKYDCISTALCLQTWDAYKYKTQGEVRYAGYANHHKYYIDYQGEEVAFECYGGNSHPKKGDTPGSEEYKGILRGREMNVENFKSMGI